MRTNVQKTSSWWWEGVAPQVENEMYGAMRKIFNVGSVSFGVKRELYETVFMTQNLGHVGGK